MGNAFKRYEHFFLWVLLLLTISAFILGVCGVVWGWSTGGQWVGTAGLLATVAGIVQLEVSGFFGRVIEYYSNVKKHPYGPLSPITRKIIDDPDGLISNDIRSLFIFDERTGFWLIVLGTFLQIVGVWTIPVTQYVSLS